MVSFYKIFTGGEKWQRDAVGDEEEEEKTEHTSAPVCSMCRRKHSARNDRFNWIPNGMLCCGHNAHIDCLAKWRFDDLKESNTKCQMCQTYVPAQWFFEKVYETVERFVEYTARGEGRVRPRAPAYFKLCDPSVSVEDFLASERTKLENFAIVYGTEAATESTVGNIVDVVNSPPVAQTSRWRIKREEEDERRQRRRLRQRASRSVASSFDKQERIIDKFISKSLQSINSFKTMRTNQAMKDIDCLEEILRRQERAVLLLEKMSETRNTLFQNVCRSGQIVSDEARAAWNRNTEVVTLALQAGRDFIKDFEEEIRFKREDFHEAFNESLFSEDSSSHYSSACLFPDAQAQ